MNTWNKIANESFHLRATGHIWTAPAALIRDIGAIILAEHDLNRVYATVLMEEFAQHIVFDDGSYIPPVILDLLKKMILDHFAKVAAIKS